MGRHPSRAAWLAANQHRQTYDRIQTAFPGNPVPGIVVVEARDVRSASVQRGVDSLVERARETPGLLSGIQTRVSPNGRVESIAIPLAGDGTDEKSEAAPARLRELVPATVGHAPGVDWAGVTGETAGTHDFNETMKSHLPLVFAFVLGIAFLLLLMTFRSVVIPLQAIALNLLLVGAAYGLLVLCAMKQMGVGLAVAILIDATVIRGVLLPATLKLLGERAWYLPRALRWVSRGERSSREAAAPVRA